MLSACFHTLQKKKVCYFWKRDGPLAIIGAGALASMCHVLHVFDTSSSFCPHGPLNRKIPNPFCRRFFRARKYNVDEAYKMFNAVCLAREKDRHCVFYDNLDIDLFDETRNIVGLPPNILQNTLNICSSTLTGQAIETTVASLSTSSTWKPSPPQP